MRSTYSPSYYTSMHGSMISSICKTILPFSFKKRRIPAIAAAEQRLSKQQSDNLKWQQESFHQMLKLMGLCKEGILHENEVFAFRTHVIQTLTESPIDYDHEPAVLLRDKLVFLQDLFYAKCITEDEYHASKRPLLQRLAVQGAKIRESDVIVISNEEWSVIDLNEKKRRLVSKNKLNESSTINNSIKGDKNGKPKEDAISDSLVGRHSTENPFWNSCLNEKESESKSILMSEEQSGRNEKGKNKPFFKPNQKEKVHSISGPSIDEQHDRAFGDKEQQLLKLVKRTWGFDGFKKWKKNESHEDETAPFSSSLSGKSDDASYNVQNDSHPDFFVDEVLGENIKKEKRHGDWTTFDEENTHPNLFASQDHHSYTSSINQNNFLSSSMINASNSIDKGFKYNPFSEL